MLNLHTDVPKLSSKQSRYYLRININAESVECPIISGAVAYDNTITRKLYMLVYHQDIYCKSMSIHIMRPMKICVAGVIMNELPKLLAEKSN